MKDYKALFSESHFDFHNTSRPRLLYEYRNETRQKTYLKLMKSHTLATGMRQRLEEEIQLLKFIEKESLKGLYENWLLDLEKASNDLSEKINENNWEIHDDSIEFVLCKFTEIFKDFV